MKPGTPVYQLLGKSSLNKHWRLTIIICFFGLTNTLFAQNRTIHGIVVSQTSGEKIAFASVSWKKSGNGCVTDSNGVFVIYPRLKEDTLIISHVGYVEYSLPVHARRNNDSLIVVLTEKKGNEIIVNKKYNRGLVWWKKIVQHKSNNDPRRFRNFSCDLYKKMEMDLTNITPEAFMKVKLLKPFQFLTGYMDSVSDNKNFLPVFMKETISKYWLRTNPEEKKERIEASRTSGMKNEVVLHFIDGLKLEIDVYDNSIILFGKEFISPLSDDASVYYNFKAADTQYVNGRRFLHLFFNPRIAGENNFSGDCWIDYATWAVSSMQLKVSATANINYVNRLQIKQEFERTTNNNWIFSKNQFVAEISPLSKNKIAFIIRQSSIYQHINLQANNAVIPFPVDNSNDEVVLNDSAKNRNEEYWNQHRPEPLTQNEKNVYKMMDTLNNMSLFRKYREAADFFLSGRKKIGKIEIGPWYKWISTNQMEKVRLRFDLATSEKFSKSTYIHSYIAYGIGDNQFNGGLDFRHRFQGNGGYSIQASYLHDLNNGGTDKGGVGLTQDNMFSQLIRKPGVPQKYYHADEYLFDLGKDWPSKFSAHVFFKRGSYETYAPLPPLKDLSTNQKNIFSAEAGINLRYAPSEKKISNYRKDYRYFGNQPIFEFSWAHGIPGVFGSMYQYNRLFAQVSQKFRIPRWGQIDYRVYGGRIIGEALPFMLLEVHPGNDLFYYSKQSFNLMNRFEYLSDRYAGFSIEHDFEKKLINLVPFLRKTNVRQFWNLKAVWGNLSASNKILNCKEYSGYAMQSLNGKPYIEIGTGLDNIFKYFRVDCIWRLSPSIPGPAAIPEKYQAPAAHFGVFGSYHIQF
jgi:hypothetical protein